MRISRIGLSALLLALVCATIFGGSRAFSAMAQDTAANAGAAPHRAAGSFTVKMTPQAEEKADGVTIGRILLDKHYSGGLVATGSGPMLTAMTPVEASAGYVLIERVAGTLDGRAGGFVLQHHGILDRGRPSQIVVIVPDSGTGALKGIAGTMTISIAPDGRHDYELRYTLPAG